MPNRSISTVIVGRHKLLRSGISSLIEEYSFNVVATFGSVEDAGQNRFADSDPELVLICIQNTDRALKELADIREQWPTCKIVILFDHLPPQQFQQLGQASIDGCIPLRVSRELLIRTLKLIVLDRARILIHDELTRNCAFQDEHRDERQAEQLQLKELSIEDSSLISNGADPRDNLALRLTPVRSSDRASVRSPEFPLLSGREEAILDGLVRGLSNKQIARECSITEATVKVHMKSILRKIRVSNRTQAAIWALDRNSRFDVMPTLKS
uniref:Two component transcriptional regulator, LuxR family n=1 Tax=Rhodopseudomonas palustris (strain BisA53) TaxID=316055 RepID=Q07KU0_RHOP5